MERDATGLAADLRRRVVDRLRDLQPGTIAVLVTGSYAKGTASMTSDLDLTAITSEAPQVAYRAWFQDRPGSGPLHVSAAAMTMDAWLQRCDRPASWSLGFPAIVDARYLWTRPETIARLGEPPSAQHPRAEPELEDFVDFALKAKKCAAAGDELGLRWFAQAGARLVPGLLLGASPGRIVRDRRDALDAALSLVAAPEGYADDMRACLGLADVPAGDVRAAIVRLGTRTLAFLRDHAPDVDPMPDIARYLRDGTLERYLNSIE